MKKGMSLMVTIVIIIVMSILLGVIMTIGSEYIPMLELNEFAVELLNIQNATDEYFLKNSSYPTVDSMEFDLSNLSSADKSEYQNETATNNIINFQVLDLELLGISDNKFGNNKETNDVYVVSEETGLVYYLQGVTYKEKTYYTLNKDLYDQTGITPSVNQTSNRIVKYDVIFEVSETKYTQNPVTVNVKIPKDATVNSITTTNSKSVSTETVQGLYKVVSINETSENKNGNYSITVNYTYNESTKEVVYDITNFDNTAPTFTKSQTIDGTMKTVQITATDDISGVKTIKYEIGKIEDLAYFVNYGKNATHNKFIVSDMGAYTIYIEDNAGNKVSQIVEEVPQAWSSSVTAIVDGVPIPKRFVVSPYDGENTKDDGLVIYELNLGENQIPSDETQYESWTTRNQYVWVPVDKETFTTKFIRQNFLNNATITNVLGTAGQYWEVVLNKSTNMPLANQDITYMSLKTRVEVQEIYASVKKYGGFFIARYEAGIDTPRKANTEAIITGTNVHSKMGKIAYNFIGWNSDGQLTTDDGGTIEVARSIYQRNDSSYGVVSTLVYGVQWDTTLQWLLDTNGVTTVANSTSYGNHLNHDIKSADELNEDALVWDVDRDGWSPYYRSKNDSEYPKTTSSFWFLSTGALKAAKVNNIYDMAGNMGEQTMEGCSAAGRVQRGGYVASNGDAAPIANRGVNLEAANGYNGDGFRIALYIK